MKPILSLSAFLAIIIVGSLTILNIPFISIVQASTQVTGIIGSDTTWTAANSPYTLAGNVLVNNAVTLTIEPGVTVDLNGYYIMVNGTLQARGTSIDKITFNGAGSVSFTQASTSWNEQTQSGCIIENAIITTTVSSENAVKISSNTINSALTVTSNTIVTNNIIKGNVNGGIVSGNNIIGEVNSANIFSNNITGNVGCSGTASNNHIKGQVSAVGNSAITNNTIVGDTSSANNIGVAVSSGYIAESGYPRIENNIITNCSIGISVGVLIRSWFSINIPEIRNNLIIQNEVGIQYSISRQEPWETNQTIIENNTIAKNAIGIKFSGPAQECQIINNNIEENSNYSIFLQQTTNDVNVTNNWWGTTDESRIADSIYDFYKDFNLGKVNFVPFLTEPNPQATPDTYVPTPIDEPSPSPPTSPSPSGSPAVTPTPGQEPAESVPFEAVLGAVIVVAVIAAGLGLLVYLVRKK